MPTTLQDFSKKLRESLRANTENFGDLNINHLWKSQLRHKAVCIHGEPSKSGKVKEAAKQNYKTSFLVWFNFKYKL